MLAVRTGARAVHDREGSMDTETYKFVLTLPVSAPRPPLPAMIAAAAAALGLAAAFFVSEIQDVSADVTELSRYSRSTCSVCVSCAIKAVRRDSIQVHGATYIQCNCQ